MVHHLQCETNGREEHSKKGTVVDKHATIYVSISVISLVTCVVSRLLQPVTGLAGVSESPNSRCCSFHPLQASPSTNQTRNESATRCKRSRFLPSTVGKIFNVVSVAVKKGKQILNFKWEYKEPSGRQLQNTATQRTTNDADEK